MQLQMDSCTVTDVQLICKGFYLIEFSHDETTKLVLTMNPMDLRRVKAFFSPRYNGFNTQEVAKNEEKIYIMDFNAQETTKNLRKRFSRSLKCFLTY